MVINKNLKDNFMSYINWIPGAFTPMDFMVVEELAKLVPENGTIVEIGSHFGRSTRGWLDNSKSSVKVVAIDPWWSWTHSPSVMGDIDLLPDSLKNSYSNRKAVFDYFIPDDRVIKIKKYSPLIDITPIQHLGLIDLIFIDGDHSRKAVELDINFWYSKLSSTGIICGHDYNYKEVNEAVNEFAKNNNLEVIEFPHCSSLWVIKPANMYNELFSLPRYEEIFKWFYFYSWIKPNEFAGDPHAALVWEESHMRNIDERQK